MLLNWNFPDVFLMTRLKLSFFERKTTEVKYHFQHTVHQGHVQSTWLNTFGRFLHHVEKSHTHSPHTHFLYCTACREVTICKPHLRMVIMLYGVQLEHMDGVATWIIWNSSVKEIFLSPRHLFIQWFIYIRMRLMNIFMWDYNSIPLYLFILFLKISQLCEH